MVVWDFFHQQYDDISISFDVMAHPGIPIFTSQRWDNFAAGTQPEWIFEWEKQDVKKHVIFIFVSSFFSRNRKFLNTFPKKKRHLLGKTTDKTPRRRLELGLQVGLYILLSAFELSRRLGPWKRGRHWSMSVGTDSVIRVVFKVLLFLYGFVGYIST